MLALDNVCRSHFKHFNKAVSDMCTIVTSLQKVHILGDSRVHDPANTLDTEVYEGNNPNSTF